MAVLLAGICSLGYGQTEYEWEKPPKSGETTIAIINQTISAGEIAKHMHGGYHKVTLPNDINTYKNYSKEELYNQVYQKAKSDYGQSYPTFVIRNFTSAERFYSAGVDKVEVSRNKYYLRGRSYKYYDCRATLVYNPKADAYTSISKVLTKALSSIRSGSKIAIDALFVSNGDDREEYKDFVISILLDNGYKVVAKEYLERLYEEQLNQQSGIYNENTVVMENNFSAVGYFLNLNVTESFIRAQVVNVSTGEYEGNVIESLNPSGSNSDDNGSLSKALTRSLNNVRMGSKVAIDGIIVPNGTDKECYKDQIINLLLKTGYKVVAKEYLERLYNEQQDQLSGIYNESTTVQENNFSAVGYYINVKVTEASVRVQVVNVSTGEYEGNAIVNF